MATLKFAHPVHPELGPLVPWKPGEIVLVKIAAVEADGSYVAETIDTIPGDIQERHQRELEELAARHREHLRQLGIGEEPAPES